MFEETPIDLHIKDLESQIFNLKKQKEAIQEKRYGEIKRMAMFELQKEIGKVNTKRNNNDNCNDNDRRRMALFESMKIHKTSSSVNLEIKIEDMRYTISHLLSPNGKIQGDYGYYTYGGFSQKKTLATKSKIGDQLDQSGQPKYKITKFPNFTINVSPQNIHSEDMQNTLAKIYSIKEHADILCDFINWIDVDAFIRKTQILRKVFQAHPIMEIRHIIFLVLAKRKESSLNALPRDILIYICKMLWQDMCKLVVFTLLPTKATKKPSAKPSEDREEEEEDAEPEPEPVEAESEENEWDSISEEP